MEKIDWNEYFYYDETSPSCLRWKVGRRSGKNLNIVKVKKDDVAGSISVKGYYQVKLQGGVYLCHRIIYEIMNNVSLKPNEHIDHVNGCRFDNRINNLRVVTNAENSRNAKKSKYNSSGVTGVREERKGEGHYYYYTAQCYDLEGKFHRKHFSIAKLGLLPAFAQAVAHREKMIKELNEQGAGYSDRHGN